MDELEIREWKDFALTLRRLARWDLEKVDRALDEALVALPNLNETDRKDLLRLGQAVLERSSKFAVYFLRSAPRSLLFVLPSHRSLFLKWAEILAVNSRETLIDFFEKSREIIEPLCEKDGLKMLEMGMQLAKKDWAISFKFFLNFNTVIFEIKKENLTCWFEAGIPLLDKSPMSGMAYYSLESKKSLECGKFEGSAINLENMAGPLKVLSQALTGKDLGVRGLRGGNRHNSPFCGLWPFTDGESIYLPEVMDEFLSQELNSKALKLAAAHQAGQVEFGTFDFHLSAVSSWFPAEIFNHGLEGIADKEKPVSHLEAFFGFFPNQNLAKDLFYVLEGARIDYFLRRNYRGLANDMAILLPEFFKKRPDLQSLPLREAFVEALLQMGAFGKIEENLPWPISLYREALESLLSSFFSGSTTVRESARMAIIFYRWLAAIPNITFSTISADSEFRLDAILSPSLGEQPGMEFASRRLDGEEEYKPLSPLSYRGELRPDLVQKKLRIRAIRNLLQEMEGGFPLLPEVLRDLLEKGAELEIDLFDDEIEEFWQGLFATDLKTALTGEGTLQGPKGKKTRENLKSKLQTLVSEMAEATGETCFFYDEWDHLIHDYRIRWCRLKEKGIEEEMPEFVAQTLSAHADLVKEVRRQFQMLKPERFKKIPQLERGEEIDLNAAIEASVDRKAGHSPNEKIYIERNRKDRDFSTVFLVDMSASTDERIRGNAGQPDSSDAPGQEKKVIDIEKEALVIMAEALTELGDEYAIFGFSGYGRKDVDFFCIKDFSEAYDESVKARIGGFKAQRSTRMGPAIRHAAGKMAGRDQKVRNLILISDGYPQDYDYGEDRTSKEYALQDTKMALEEAGRKNIHTFCITVDRAGHDYLRVMLPSSRYLVIEETEELPRELPKIYRRLTT